MFFPLNMFLKESYTYFDVLNEDTWGMRWSVIEYEMILLALSMLLLGGTLASSPSSSGTSWVMYLSKSFSSRIKEITVLPCSKFIRPSKPIFNLSMVIHIFQMRASNGNNEDLELADLGFLRKSLIFQTYNLGIHFGQKNAPCWGVFLRGVTLWRLRWEASKA